MAKKPSTGLLWLRALLYAVYCLKKFYGPSISFVCYVSQPPANGGIGRRHSKQLNKMALREATRQLRLLKLLQNKYLTVNLTGLCSGVIVYFLDFSTQAIIAGRWSTTTSWWHTDKWQLFLILSWMAGWSVGWLTQGLHLHMQMDKGRPCGGVMYVSESVCDYKMQNKKSSCCYFRIPGQKKDEEKRTFQYHST